MSKHEIVSTFDDSIKQGVLRVGDSVWVGNLYPYIVSAKSILGYRILFVLIKEQPTEFSYNKKCAFPYGVIREENGKYEIEIAFEHYGIDRERQEIFCNAFTSEETGIECVCRKKDREYFFYLRFSKEIMVEYRGENDFPVLVLPEHDAYEVE